MARSKISTPRDIADVSRAAAQVHGWTASKKEWRMTVFIPPALRRSLRAKLAGQGRNVSDWVREIAGKFVEGKI